GEAQEEAQGDTSSGGPSPRPTAAAMEPRRKRRGRWRRCHGASKGGWIVPPAASWHVGDIGGGMYWGPPPPIAAPIGCQLIGGNGVPPPPTAVTALLFKMEEANLANRAKAQELIQATNQVGGGHPQRDGGPPKGWGHNGGVEEVKLAIKPYYQKKDITKDEYKDILRKAVHKICHSRSGEINPVKVNNLVRAYVQRYKYFRRRNRRGGGPRGDAPPPPPASPPPPAPAPSWGGRPWPLTKSMGTPNGSGFTPPTPPHYGWVPLWGGPSPKV
uniref:SFR19-like C-terminal domain-containing protein n=1 Tax=Melopsittacus undulatus TaxID=13146 RepID=A0A8V5GWX4_MELUD